MQSIEKILELASKLGAEERQRLIDELGALHEANDDSSTEDNKGPYSALLALAGTFHSDHTDLSTNKYEHLAAGLSERKGA